MAQLPATSYCHRHTLDDLAHGQEGNNIRMLKVDLATGIATYVRQVSVVKRGTLKDRPMS